MATSILIVKLSSMGDVLHTLPAAQAIRAAFPQATLGWAVQSAHAELLRGQPMLDHVITWDRGARGSFLSFIRRLRAVRWDVAIDFQGLLRSAIVARLSGARRRIGFAPTRERAHWLYNDGVPLETMDRHAVERYLQLASRLTEHETPSPLVRPYLDGGHEHSMGEVPAPHAIGSGADGHVALGFDQDTAWRDRFRLYPTAADCRQVDGWLADQGIDLGEQRLIVLFPECRKDANRWPTAKFAALVRRVGELPDARVALAGGPSSRRLGNEIVAQAQCDVLRAEGHFGLLASAELLRRADVAVTGDTGPMHLAVAVGTPIVALFGPASPLRTGPYTSRAIVLREPLDCAPCFARRCPLRYDPPLCMDRIDVDRVYEAVVAQLTTGKRFSHFSHQVVGRRSA